MQSCYIMSYRSWLFNVELNILAKGLLKEIYIIIQYLKQNILLSKRDEERIDNCWLHVPSVCVQNNAINKEDLTINKLYKSISCKKWQEHL